MYIKNIQKFHHLQYILIHILIYFFIVLFFLLSSPLNTSAEESIRSCTEEMIYGVSRVEMKFEKELENFLDLRSSQADAKAKNLTLYLQNYECQLQYICQVFETPNISTLGDELPLCKTVESKKFLEENTLNFSQCSGETLFGDKSSRLDICQQFIALKKKASFDFTEKTFINQSAKENQSFFAQKITGMQKRMKVLYEKTRIFSRNFNKVMQDISCSLPDKSA